jgi:phosphoglycerol transferase MdoB-like AlkP superfamily enzyme
MPLTFICVCVASILFMQWGIAPEDSHLSDFFKSDYVARLLFGERKVFLLTAIFIAVTYLALIALINRFWIATPFVTGIFIIFSVAQRIKIRLRKEPILPSDVALAGTDGDNIASFLTPGDKILIAHGIIAAITFAAICICLHYLLGSPRVVTFDSLRTYTISRIVLFVAPTVLICSFTANIGISDTWANRAATSMGDTPIMWETMGDASANGPLLSFLRYIRPNAMTKPEGYSKDALEEVAKRYESSAEQLNSTRTSNLADNTVIMILSESYSDPTRVPNISLNEDPMPNIRTIKNSTTSGLMLSSGYGGGTAGLEFQALTGLGTSNFNASLVSPYQQLVPSMKWTPTFNQQWSTSQAIHPFTGTFYLRNTNFKKFGFDHFWTDDGPEYVQHTERIDRNPYISDASAYTETLQRISENDQSQFVQLTTMQNHTGYNNWYDNNQFQATTIDGSVLSNTEKTSIDTYAKGVSYTDNATRDFLNSLNELQKPVTVIFYGDHLPGIYENASKDAKNSQALHETDYFIWSNSASSSAQTKLSSEESNYTSPNYLMAQAAEHTNSKVSPYLAFLTEMHTAIPAMEPAISAAKDWSSPDANSGQLYLDSSGNKINTSRLSEEQKSLLKDYKLIQYDITVGKNYLKDFGFMDLPEEKK